MTIQFVAQLLAQHMGQLHAYEQYLVLAVAFGPFVVLGIVVFWVKRRDLAEETEETEEASEAEADGPHERPKVDEIG